MFLFLNFVWIGKQIKKKIFIIIRAQDLTPFYIKSHIFLHNFNMHYCPEKQPLNKARENYVIFVPLPNILYLFTILVACLSWYLNHKYPYTSLLGQLLRLCFVPISTTLYISFCYEQLSIYTLKCILFCHELFSFYLSFYLKARELLRVFFFNVCVQNLCYYL